MYIHGILCFRLSMTILDNLEVSGPNLGVRDFFALDHYTPPFENPISGDSYLGHGVVWDPAPSWVL